MQATLTPAMARHAHMTTVCGTGWAGTVAKADENHDETNSVGNIIATEFAEDGTVSMTGMTNYVRDLPHNLDKREMK